MPRLAFCACCLTALVTACGSSTTSATGTPTVATPTSGAETAISGNGFSAQVPVGWTSSKKTMQGAFEYFLSSKGTVNGLGIPQPGETGITVQEIPFSVLEANGAPNLANATAAQLAHGLVGTPKDATSMRQTKAITSTTLASASAATVEYTYTFLGTPNVQVDVVALHGTNAYLIELDGEPSVQQQSEAAFTTFLKSWTWTT